MKTTSVNIMNLCVPCANRCRYCLLSWDGKLRGIDYKRSETYARRFYDWAKENRPDLMVTFGFAYSMEHPDLLGAIDFMQEIGSPMGRFLQLDGLKFRNSEGIREFLSGVMAHGVELIDLTFYGTREYHDRFAARKGDFDFMVDILRQANALGLEVNADIPVTRENVAQLDSLLEELGQYRLNSLSCFIPHQEGRGVSLNAVRLRLEDLEALPEQIKSRFNRKRFKSEAQWLAENSFSVPTQRALSLSLTPENVDFFEGIPFEEAIAYLEKLDDGFYQAVPSLPELAEQFGDAENTELYSERDLYLKYQHRYIAEHGLDIYNINDERQCSARRF